MVRSYRRIRPINLNYRRTLDSPQGVTAVETQDVSLVVEQELDYESVYFWRVRAVNEVGSGQWSAIRVFSTVENPQPGLVTLLQPGNGDVWRYHNARV